MVLRVGFVSGVAFVGLVASADFSLAAGHSLFLLSSYTSTFQSITITFLLCLLLTTQSHSLRLEWLIRWSPGESFSIREESLRRTRIHNVDVFAERRRR